MKKQTLKNGTVVLLLNSENISSLEVKTIFTLYPIILINKSKLN